MINNIKGQLLIAEDNFKAATKKQWNVVAGKLYRAQEQKRELESQIDLFKLELAELSHHRNTCGDEYYYQLQSMPGSVQYGIIPELQHVDLNPYRKEKRNFWRLYKY